MLYSGNRKKHLRRLNKYTRQINNSIAEDELWRGRFVVRCVHTSFFQYEDKSGWELYAVLRFIDQKTGFFWEVGDFVNSFCFGSKLFWLMNEFIVERCEVWSENPRPGSQDWYNQNPQWR